MILRVIAGLWLTLMTLGASFGATQWLLARQAAAKREADGASTLDLHKLPTLSVPMLGEGRVQGYIVLQLAYQADRRELRDLGAQPDAFIQDEALRFIYGDARYDFRTIERVDFKSFSATVRERVAARLKSNAVRDIVIEAFNLARVEPPRR